MDVIFEARVMVLLAEFFGERCIAADVVDGPTLRNFLRENGVEFAAIAPTPAQAIERNQVITPPMSPGADSVLETTDGAGDTFEKVGPAVVFPRYTAPKDKRVQQLLKDAEAERASEKPVREIFRDPRLDPNYRQPKAPKPK